MLTPLSGLLNLINMFPSEETCYGLLVEIVKMENFVLQIKKCVLSVSIVWLPSLLKPTRKF